MATTGMATGATDTDITAIDTTVMDITPTGTPVITTTAIITTITTQRRSILVSLSVPQSALEAAMGYMAADGEFDARRKRVALSASLFAAERFS